jgi:hypothetical protein
MGMQKSIHESDGKEIRLPKGKIKNHDKKGKIAPIGALCQFKKITLQNKSSSAASSA